ncbi:hypothetical protein HYN56_15225 [Flavobacterium crocinum]|uniref:Phosphoribosylpyrophosphate synthetase n=1 Tax=Flavobacterium crocinum TaxID=2183896 RepID=A0A2S1YNA5_9FLAO|nr:hypothetical protein [Flavobacterium crocinum]AWK05516.1 hypothetical protein HYN56_15225 [Flavobacterium crocinum]
MKREYSKHETDYIKAYQDQGYTVTYLFENDQLIDAETKIEYKPEDIFIVAHQRYEGMSDPDDMSILYVIETKDNRKGTHLLGYGPTADLEEAEFFKDIPKANYSKNADINELT